MKYYLDNNRSCEPTPVTLVWVVLGSWLTVFALMILASPTFGRLIDYLWVEVCR